MSDSNSEDSSVDFELSIDSYKPGFESHPLSATNIDDLNDYLPSIRKDNSWIVLLTILGVIFSAYLIIWGLESVWGRPQHTMLILGGSLLIFYLEDYYQIDESSIRGSIYKYSALIFAIGSMAACIYFFYAFDDLLNRLLNYYWYEYILSAFLVISTIESGRRAYGPLLPGVTLCAIGYAYFGQFIPGPLGNHPGYGTRRILEVSVLSLQGMFGQIPIIGATWVVVFIIFAGLIQSFGGMKFIRDIALSTVGRFKSGIVQVAVITSMAMGMITGSTAANTAATGSFTIPLMKSAGVDSESAAAIESVASSGGQMLPPVMGAAAFLMAELIGVPYADLIRYGLLPAILFYVCIAFTATIISIKDGIKSPTVHISRSELVSIFFNGSYIIASVAVLIHYLVIARYDPMTSAIYAIVALIGTALLLSVITAGNGKGVVNAVDVTIKEALHGLQYGARQMAPIMIILVPIAIIIEMITLTALNQTISTFMISYGNTLPILLLLGAVMSILFGLGMPTVAAYALVTIFVVPGLLEFGVDQVSSHFFVFYFAVISGITPPIALAIIIASNIADANFLETCIKAIPLGLAGFIVPFAFIYNNTLLIWDITTPLAFVVVLVGTLAIIIGLLGYGYGINYSLSTRVMYAIIGFAAIFSPMISIQIVLATVLGAHFLHSSDISYLLAIKTMLNQVRLSR